MAISEKRRILILIIVIILFAGIFIVNELNGFTIKQTFNSIKADQPNQAKVGVEIFSRPEGEDGKE